MIRVTLTSTHEEYINKNSLHLVTTESAHISTAETLDLIFHKYSITLSVPLALLAGASDIQISEMSKKLKKVTEQ